MGVARERPDVVRGGHPQATALPVRGACLADHEHAAEERQLVVVEGHRAAAEPRPHLLERPGLHARRRRGARARGCSRPRRSAAPASSRDRLVRMYGADDPGEELAAGPEPIRR